jgi:inorganic triphosphatase YgiF
MKDAGQNAARECELKFELDAAAARKIETHPLLAASIAETRRLSSVYFDTPDFALRNAGVALRVRDTGHGYVQTIKTAGPQLFDRLEWEHPVSGFEPDLAAAAATGLVPFRESEVGERLRAGFKTTIDRSVFNVVRNGSEIEIALDRGEVEAGMLRAPILELELELKRGEPTELFLLARELAAFVPLRLDIKTKAERGYALLDSARGMVEKAAPVNLDPSMTSGDAFRIIAQNCLRQIIANEEAIGAGNAEALHQMRVGLRRMRAAIRAFRDMAPGPEQQRVKTALKWMTTVLGPARDLDVFTAEVLQPLRAAKGNDASFAEAQRAFMERRAQAYAAATTSVRSDRFRRALLDMAEWIEVGSWTVDAGLRELRERPVREHAEELLTRLRKKIRKQDKLLEEMNAAGRHKLRIRAKTLRYIIEFFARLFAEKENQRRREAALRALKDVQDALGAVNDLAARKALAADGHDLSDEAAGLLTFDDGRVELLLEKAQAARAAFAEVKSFWK